MTRRAAVVVGSARVCRRASVTLTRMGNGVLRARVFAEFQDLRGKGLQLRAVVAEAPVRPCYAAGVSSITGS